MVVEFLALNFLQLIFGILIHFIDFFYGCIFCCMSLDINEGQILDQFWFHRIHLLPTAHILPREGEEDKTNVRETEAPGRAGGGEGVRGVDVFAVGLASFAVGFNLCNVIWIFFSLHKKRNDRSG